MQDTHGVGPITGLVEGQLPEAGAVRLRQPEVAVDPAPGGRHGVGVFTLDVFVFGRVDDVVPGRVPGRVAVVLLRCSRRIMGEIGLGVRVVDAEDEHVEEGIHERTRGGDEVLGVQPVDALSVRLDGLERRGDPLRCFRRFLGRVVGCARIRGHEAVFGHINGHTSVDVARRDRRVSVGRHNGRLRWAARRPDEHQPHERHDKTNAPPSVRVRRADPVRSGPPRCRRRRRRVVVDPATPVRSSWPSTAVQATRAAGRRHRAPPLAGRTARRLVAWRRMSHQARR